MDKMSTPTLPTDLSQLHAFVRVVEAGSFAEAARRAGTTTSAMSKAIARFERTHGVRLLHRTTHSIALTDEGDRLVDAAKTLFEDLEKVEASLAEIATGQVAGRVRITAPTSFARACIMPRLPDFLRENPTIHIEIKFRNEILDLAAEGVDLAIRSGPLDRLPGHQARKLFTFPWIACASPGYLATYGTPTSPEDLTRHEHVGFRNPATGQVLSWRFSNCHGKVAVRFTPKPTHVFDDAHSSLSLVREGFGVGWGPAWIVADDLNSGQLVEVMRPWRVPEEPLWMVRTSSRQTPRRTLRAMEFLGSLASTWKF
jgi:DNA-binding transcriptional LysR family regulator